MIKYLEFSDYDFIRLYCAMSFQKQISPLLLHQELEKRLYEFKFLPEFKDLFKDIYLKKDLTYLENDSLNLRSAFQKAQIFGLLISVPVAGDIKSIITCDEESAKEIISSYDEVFVNKMSELFNRMFNLKDDSIKMQENGISSSNKAMTIFMNKLCDNELICDKEIPIGAELKIIGKSIDEQKESYKKLHKSPLNGRNKVPRYK